MSAQLHVFKIWSIIGMTLISLAGGLLSLFIPQNRFLSLGNSFAGGFFLSGGLLHMLAESAKEIDQIAYILCIFGLLIPLFIDTFLINHQSFEDDQKLSSYLIILSLGFHSLIEGVAFGVEQTATSATKTLLVIIAHKGFASFALAVSLNKQLKRTSKVVKWIIFFSLFTPLGAIIGLLINDIQWKNGVLMSFCVKALSSGIFVYVGLIEIILVELNEQRDKKWKFIMIVCGSIIMSLL